MKLFILVICFASSSFAGLVHHQKIAFRAQPSGITYNSDFSIRSPEPQFIHKTHYAPSYKVSTTSYEPVTKVKAFSPLIAKPYHHPVDHHRHYPYHKPRYTHAHTHYSNSKPSVVVKSPVQFVSPAKLNIVEPVGLNLAREHSVHSLGHATALGYSAPAPALVEAPHAHALSHTHAYANVYAPPTIYTVNVRPQFPEVLPLTLVGQPSQVRAQYVQKPKPNPRVHPNPKPAAIISDSECFLC